MDWRISISGDDATTNQLAALLVRLEQDLYFEAEKRGRGYRALSEDEVLERKAAVVRNAARSAEKARFRRWLLECTEESPEFAGGWVDRLKDYVLRRERSVHAAWVERMAGTRVDPRVVFNRLVRDGVWEPDENLDLIRAGAPVEFPAVVIEAADGLRLSPLLDDGRRRDLTDLAVYAIDDAATTDMDDAVSVHVRADGTRQVGVHITDVAGAGSAGFGNGPGGSLEGFQPVLPGPEDPDVSGDVVKRSGKSAAGRAASGPESAVRRLGGWYGRKR